MNKENSAPQYSFEVFLRQQLNSSLANRVFFVRLLTPLLRLLAWIVAGEAQRRRRKGYVDKPRFSPSHNLHEPTQPQRPFLVCVGNVLLGGTGKSPLVMALAQWFLQRGFHVAIVSRGYKSGHEDTCFLINGADATFDATIAKDLSDENREMLNHLDISLPRQKLFFLQGAQRQVSLEKWMSHLNEKAVPLWFSIGILDDGLQHFSCPRDTNIAIWDSQLWTQAPPCSLPLGPYREGFSREDLIDLQGVFDFNLWSPNLPHLTTLPLLENPRCGNLKRTVQVWNLNQKRMFLTRDIQEKALLVTGIAGPERVQQALEKWQQEEGLTDVQVSSCYLGDHADLQTKHKMMMRTFPMLIFTGKDYARWSLDAEFQEIIKNKTVAIIRIEVHVTGIGGNDSDSFFEQLLTTSQKGMMRKNVAGLLQINNQFVGFERASGDGWQCVQGGVELFDESPFSALQRELDEEIGLSGNAFECLYESALWRPYRFPEHMVTADDSHVGQVQKWFLLKMRSPQAIRLDARDKDFKNWQLFNIHEFIQKYCSWKKDIFIDFCDEAGIFKQEKNIND